MSGSQQSIYRLGLTGSIGAGKSTVAQLLRERGLTVTDADALARSAAEQPDMLAEIAARWPSAVQGGRLDHAVGGGRLDRAALAAQVFGAPSELAALEALLHPRIRAATQQAVRAAAERGEPLIVHDIPLLYEKGLEEGLSAVWVVDAPRKLRLERLQRRSGLTPEQVLAREAQQLPAAEKRRRADVVLENAGTLDDLARQVDAALAEWPR